MPRMSQPAASERARTSYPGAEEAHHHDRDVVALRGAAGKPANGGHDPPDLRLRAGSGSAFDDLEQTGVAELLTVAVEGLRHAVAEDHDRRAGLQADRRLHVRGELQQADDGPALFQKPDS